MSDLLKDNQWLKIRPLTLARLDEPDEEAIEFILYESIGDEVYERTIAALDADAGLTLERVKANLDYVRNRQPDKVDRLEAEYSFTPYYPA